MSYYDDVGEFHAKFGLPRAGEDAPRPLAADVLVYRLRFMLEELAEFAESQGAVAVGAALREVVLPNDQVLPDGETVPVAGLANGADALADLVYVALGTAHLMHLPLDAVWAEVQRANLGKERATSARDKRSKRGHALDVVKPANWRAPNHWPAIYEAALRAR
jgi:predicted HAD superfamily Cof-like phosphohydrolase